LQTTLIDLSLVRFPHFPRHHLAVISVLGVLPHAGFNQHASNRSGRNRKSIELRQLDGLAAEFAAVSGGWDL